MLVRVCPDGCLRTLINPAVAADKICQSFWNLPEGPEVSHSNTEKDLERRHVLTSSNRHPDATQPKPALNVDAVQARQGRLGRPVAVVLAGGLLLALIAWGAVEYWGETLDSSVTGSTAPAVSQPANSPKPDAGTTSEDKTTPENTAPTDRDPTYQSGTGGPSPVVTPDGTQR
ncbi:hypothetical protein J2Y48_000223 [Mycoplana sp. BE70]|nr:hypothetical protein [Mycoplana sp. BE70]